MLFDPKWNRQNQPSIAGFKAWLEQRRLEKFDYQDCSRCALAQYLQSIGTTWWDLLGKDSGLLTRLNWFAASAARTQRSQWITGGDVLAEMQRPGITG